MCECQGNPLDGVTLALHVGLPYLLVNRALLAYITKQKLYYLLNAGGLDFDGRPRATKDALDA